VKYVASGRDFFAHFDSFFIIVPKWGSPAISRTCRLYDGGAAPKRKSHRTFPQVGVVANIANSLRHRYKHLNSPARREKADKWGFQHGNRCSACNHNLFTALTSRIRIVSQVRQLRSKPQTRRFSADGDLMHADTLLVFSSDPRHLTMGCLYATSGGNLSKPEQYPVAG
jgi:hypothetical protein